MGIEGISLNIVKAIYDKKTFFLGVKYWKHPPTRQGCLLSPLSFNIVLEVLATEKRKK